MFCNQSCSYHSDKLILGHPKFGILSPNTLAAMELWQRPLNFIYNASGGWDQQPAEGVARRAHKDKNHGAFTPHSSQ